MDRNQGIATLMALAGFVWLTLVQAAPATQHEAGAAGAPVARSADAARGPAAVAEIRPLGAGEVNGTLTFQQQGELVRISGVIRGLSPGKHGLHVHEGTSCDDRGGHFSPSPAPHGSPDAQQRHMGDLGNLAAGADGEVAFLRVDHELSLSGPDSIIGRVLVIHQGEDDYVTQPSGDSGEQIACGRIVAATGGAGAD